MFMKKERWEFEYDCPNCGASYDIVYEFYCERTSTSIVGCNQCIGRVSPQEIRDEDYETQYERYLDHLDRDSDRG